MGFLVMNRSVVLEACRRIEVEGGKAKKDEAQKNQEEVMMEIDVAMCAFSVILL